MPDASSPMMPEPVPDEEGDSIVQFDPEREDLAMRTLRVDPAEVDASAVEASWCGCRVRDEVSVSDGVYCGVTYGGPAPAPAVKLVGTASPRVPLQRRRTPANDSSFGGRK